MKARLLTASALLALAVAASLVLLWPGDIVGTPGSKRPSKQATGVSTPSAPAIAQKAAAASNRSGSIAASGEDCLAALAAPEGSSQLMEQERRREIERLLERQDDGLAQALAADLAGVAERQPLMEGEPFTRDQSLRYAAPPPDDERRLSDEERRQLSELLAAEGIEGLIALGDASLFGAEWRFTTTTGHLIGQYADGRVPRLPAVADALAIGLHELATAIAVGISANDFAILLDAADVDPATTWLGGVNLAKVAAIHGRPAILGLLTARGVDPVAARRWGRASVLDDIAVNYKLAEAERAGAFAEVVRQLIAAGDRPYLPSTRSALADWLPEVPLPALHPDSAVLLPALADAAETVAELDAEWAAKVAAAERLEARCETQLADPEVALAVFRGTDLASKLRYQEALKARLERELERLTGEAATSDREAGAEVPTSGADQEEATRRLFSLAEAGRWQEALAFADQVGGYAHLMLLSTALDSDAPLAVLLALARRADSVPLPTAPPGAPDWLARWTPLGDGAMSLAYNPRADIAAVVEALEPFGLDLHYVNFYGENAFHVLARHPDDDVRWRFAELLASRSVSPKPSPYGLDPLDTVLTRLVEYPTVNAAAAVRFARFLIDYGAPIEESHLLLARQLAVADEEAYRRLVSAVPELGW